MDKFGVQVSLISAFTPPDYSFEGVNAAIEKSVRANPSRFRGMARVDPRITGAGKTLKKFLRKNSFFGVRLDPFEQAFKVNDSFLRPIYEIAEEFDAPVMIESGYPILSLPLQVAEVAGEYRKVKFIMTHAGQTSRERAVRI